MNKPTPEVSTRLTSTQFQAGGPICPESRPKMKSARARARTPRAGTVLRLLEDPPAGKHSQLLPPRRKESGGVSFLKPDRCTSLPAFSQRSIELEPFNGSSRSLADLGDHHEKMGNRTIFANLGVNSRPGAHLISLESRSPASPDHFTQVAGEK